MAIRVCGGRGGGGTPGRGGSKTHTRVDGPRMLGGWVGGWVGRGSMTNTVNPTASYCLTATACLPASLPASLPALLLFVCSLGGWPYLMLQCTFLVFALY